MIPPFLTSRLLDGVEGVRHGFFTRRGGVSGGIYESLNAGRGSADRVEDVAENRRRVAAALGANTLNTAYQVHSARVVAIDRDFDLAAPEADGVVTATPGLTCGALAADCAPILLVDPRARVVGAAHAGWKGALSGVVESAVREMDGLGARADRLRAAVGPCIGPLSYEVGAEFRDRFILADLASARLFRAGAARGKFLFDLPAFVLGRLRGAGVASAEWVGADTFADADFFSNRRAFKRGEPDYGRLVSAIVLTADVREPNTVDGSSSVRGA